MLLVPHLSCTFCHTQWEYSWQKTEQSARGFGFVSSFRFCLYEAEPLCYLTVRRKRWNDPELAALNITGCKLRKTQKWKQKKKGKKRKKWKNRVNICDSFWFFFAIRPLTKRSRWQRDSLWANKDLTLNTLPQKPLNQLFRYLVCKSVWSYCLIISNVCIGNWPKCHIKEMLWKIFPFLHLKKKLDNWRECFFGSSQACFFFCVFAYSEASFSRIEGCRPVLSQGDRGWKTGTEHFMKGEWPEV